MSVSFWEFFQNHRMAPSRLSWLTYSVFRTEYEECLVSSMWSGILLVLWMSFNAAECVQMSFTLCLSLSYSSECLLADNASSLCWFGTVFLHNSMVLKLVLGQNQHISFILTEARDQNIHTKVFSFLTWSFYIIWEFFSLDNIKYTHMHCNIWSDV